MVCPDEMWMLKNALDFISESMGRRDLDHEASSVLG
jgi:hypothetical protein